MGRAGDAAFLHAEYDTWLQRERLLSHALLAAQHIEEYQFVSVEAGRLLYQTAWYLKERARYQEAEPLYQQALRIQESHLGAEHLDVATSLNGLAILYHEQGKYAEAETLYQRALRIREQHLGSVHPDVAALLNNLANLYGQQGKYAEAEPLHQRALHIWEQHLGLQHCLVAFPLIGLAILCKRQGKYAKAKVLLQRVSHIREQALGTHSPKTTETREDLIALFQEMGQTEGSNPLEADQFEI